jgi:hypothetical protein
MKVSSKQCQNRESSKSLERSPLVNKVRLSQQGTGKQVRLGTLLDEIGLSDRYEGHYEEAAPETHSRKTAFKRISNRRLASRKIPNCSQRRRTSSKESENENDLRPRSQVKELDSSSESAHSDAKQLDILSKKYQYHHQIFREETGSSDSYSRDKEAKFDLSENNINQKRNSKPLRHVDNLGNPSPGEGLRNALGNIENRLNGNQKNRRVSMNPPSRKQSSKEAGEKGFATLVEELIQRPNQGVSKNITFY